MLTLYSDQNHIGCGEKPEEQQELDGMCGKSVFLSEFPTIF
jgi:hypothetical protein